MKEVILNDECIHCNDRECHDGEHFCNQAMKENSFYKNAKLYKELEVIQRPTYEELEKENAELKADNDARKFAMAMSEKVEKQLREENADLQKSYEELYNSMRMIKDQRNKLEKDNESLENVKNIYIGDLLKAKEIINRLSTCFSSYSSNIFEEELLKEAEQFIKE